MNDERISEQSKKISMWVIWITGIMAVAVLIPLGMWISGGRIFWMILIDLLLLVPLTVFFRFTVGTVIVIFCGVYLEIKEQKNAQ